MLLIKTMEKYNKMLICLPLGDRKVIEFSLTRLYLPFSTKGVL